MQQYSTDWHKTVYHLSEDDRPDDWEIIKARIVKRDHWECQRCGCSFNLSIHHIIPRASGGGHNDENLITLCVDCHDYVELEGIRTATLIRNCAEEPIIDTRPIMYDWHAWVYGGARRPLYIPKSMAA